MTIDQFQAEFSEAIASLPGAALVKFKTTTSKTSGQSFDAVDAIQQVGTVTTVYPDPNSSDPAHVLITFA